jgi:hypothetical protein
MPQASLDPLPVARVTHCMPGRVRIRFSPALPTSTVEKIREHLEHSLACDRIQANTATGSILFQGPDLTLDTLAGAGRSGNLFRLVPPDAASPALVTRHARRQVKRIDTGIRRLTGNSLNLSGSVFLVLIGHAMTEIIQGRLVLPTWFTALWFATTIYNREWIGPGSDGGSLIDHGDADAH